MMLKLRYLFPIVFLFVAIAPSIAQEPKVLNTQKEKISYALGVNAAKQLKSLGGDVDLETLFKAFRDVYSGGKLLLEEDELRSALTAFQNELTQKANIAAEQNKKAGEAFLAENKTKEGVITLPSGLQYKILKQGDGNKPQDADTVEVNYKGTLIDGTEFDSSYKRGESTSFPVNGVIPGFGEALKLMPVGSKWQLFIPTGLAYGERGAGGDIKPNSTLIFEMELLAIKPVSPAK